MATETSDFPAGEEVFLSCGEDEAVVSPFGASLRGYYRRTTKGIEEIVTCYAGAVDPGDRSGRGLPHNSGTGRCMRSEQEIGKKIGGQGDTLIPFPGRIRNGAYVFDGRHYQMELNDKEGPNAIHGFLRSEPWLTIAQSVDRVRFYTTINAADYTARGYPFSLSVEVNYRLNADGLECAFVIKNTGDHPAPAAAGFHPYLTAGADHIDSCELMVPMESLLQFDGLLPTGEVIPASGTPLDFLSPRLIGATSINNCYLNPRRDPDGMARVRLRNPGTGRTVVVWMDQAFNYVVLYSGDPLPPEHRRRALAIEPMTCGSDAFNHPEWGLAALQPGQKLHGRWGVGEDECVGG